MKISQRYPQLMDFYEKRPKKNEHFLASNAIDFGGMKIFEQSLVCRRKKKHIIMQKLDGPLKDLARVSIYNSNFAKAQQGILYIKSQY